MLKYILKLPNININATFQETDYNEKNEKILGKPMTALQLCQKQGKIKWVEMIKQYKS